MEFELEELETATNNFSPSQIIGKGSHGKIYKGVLKNGTIVAIKKQSSGLQKLQDNSKLENESKILSSLPENPHLINLLGTSHDNKILVLEHMPNGTFQEYLNSFKPPSWPKRLQIALQIARAVNFLHESSPVIVHRDIKSSNVLFDENWNSKLADLGLSLRLDGHQRLMLPAGTIGYIDPEYTTPSYLSTKVDVFSYGVVLLELLSGRKVIDVSKTPAWIVEWSVGLIERRRGVEVFDRRVEVPRCMEGVVEKMLEVTVRCVSENEKYRPSMREVVAELESLVVVEEVRVPVRFSLFMLNCLREVVVSWKRRKLGVAKCAVVRVEGGGASDEDGRGSGGGGVLKGTLLFRDILADLTLK